MAASPNLRIILPLTLLVAAAGALIWLQNSGEGGVPTDSGPAEATAGPAESGLDTDPEAESASTGQSPVRNAVDAGASAKIEYDPVIRAALCGFRGRLIDHAGQPLGDRQVDLKRFGLESIFGADPSDSLGQAFLGELEPHIDAGSTTSDDAGHFTITGVWPQGFYALFAGVGSEQTRMLIIDETPGPGEIVDLGDIRFDLAATVIGRVVDEDGEPISGALVRTADVPGAATAMVPIERLDPSGSAIVAAPEMSRVFDAPAWLQRVYDMLPIPSAITASDGTFRLTGAAPGNNLLAVTSERRLSFVNPRVRLDAGEEKDVGAITLKEGEEAWGKVLDTAGKPVAGAEVLVGQLLAVAPFAFAAPAEPTNADGEFSLTGFRNGKVVAAARRRPNDPWIISEPVSIMQDLVIHMPAEHTLTLEVRDHVGEPVDNAEFRLFPDPIDGGMGPLARFGIVRPSDLEERVTALDEGRYSIDGLAAGSYQIEATATGKAISSERFELNADATRSLVLQPLESGTIVVVDHEDEPIRFASVYASEQGQDDTMPIFCGHTDSKGKVALKRCSAGEIEVLASHPAFGAKSAESQLPTDEEIRIVMAPPGTLRGIVTENGVPPKLGKYMVAIAFDGNDGGDDSVMPRLAAPDPKGEFVVEGLQPGPYIVIPVPSVRVIQSFGSMFKMIQNSMFFGMGGEPTSEKLEIRSGETTETRLDVRTEPEPIDGPSAFVTGTVLIDGQPGAGMMVSTWSGGGRSAEVGDNGRFELGQVEAGFVELNLHDTSDSASVFEPLWAKGFQLTADQSIDIVIDLGMGTVAGNIVLADGSPAGRGAITLRGTPTRSDMEFKATVKRVASTDDTGCFRIDKIPAGRYSLMAEMEGGRGAQSATVVAGSVTEGITVTLLRTHRIAGQIDMAVFGEQRPRWGWIELNQVSGSPIPADFDRAPSESFAVDTGAFAVDGLLPGKYDVEIQAYVATPDPGDDDWEGELELYELGYQLEVTGDTKDLLLRPKRRVEEETKSGAVPVQQGR